MLETLGNIGGDDALFLDVLGAPRDVLALAIQLLALQAHCTCQRDGAHLASLPVKEYLGGCRQPHACLGRADQCNKHSRIETARPEEQRLEGDSRRQGLISTAGQDNLAECTLRQLGVEVGKVNGV